ncbi:MAG: hypothetical protein ACD_17C00217G0001 [uncultured bacterium]|nr:MAG: hypothetical protein ACD_17C00217G0001 [uncultured bacterium]
MRLFKTLLMLFPLFAFSFPIDEYFAETLSHKIQYRDFQGGLAIIEAWEQMHPDLGNRVLAMKASIYLSQGDLEKGGYYMSHFINCLSEMEKNEPLMAFVINSYHKGVLCTIFSFIENQATANLCGVEQPPGVKVRFWLGLGQILAGLALMPFNPPAGITLIGVGAPMLIDASCDALDNKAECERNLRERQNMNGEVQKNSNFLPNRRRVYVVEAI